MTMRTVQLAISTAICENEVHQLMQQCTVHYLTENDRNAERLRLNCTVLFKPEIM